jgi:hypothetical protein
MEAWVEWEGAIEHECSYAGGSIHAFSSNCLPKGYSLHSAAHTRT